MWSVPFSRKMTICVESSLDTAKLRIKECVLQHVVSATFIPHSASYSIFQSTSPSPLPYNSAYTFSSTLDLHLTYSHCLYHLTALLYQIRPLEAHPQYLFFTGFEFALLLCRIFKPVSVTILITILSKLICTTTSCLHLDIASFTVSPVTTRQSIFTYYYFYFTICENLVKTPITDKLGLNE